MVRKHLASLRIRLLLLVVVAILPGLILAVYASFTDREREKTEAQEHAVRLAHIISIQEQDLIESAKELLVSLAHTNEVRNPREDDCNRLMVNLLSHFRRYSNLGVVDLQGNVLCSAVPLKRPVNIADRDYFRIARDSGSFGIGDFQFGRITGKPSLNLSYPVLDDKGAKIAVVFVALDLVQLGELEHRVAAQLPSGATLCKVDRKGILLARYPKSDGKIGEPAAEILHILGRLTEDQGAIWTTDSSKAPRLYTYSKIQTPLFQSGLSLILSLPEAQVLEEANSNFNRNLIGLSLVAFLILVIGTFGNERYLVKGLEALQLATKKLAEGDLRVRTTKIRGLNEIKQLGTAFNQMAESFEQREIERRSAEALLRTSEEKFRAIVTWAPVGIYQSTVDGKFLSVNQRLVEILGYDSVDDLLKRNLERDIYFIPLERRSAIEKYAQQGFAVNLELRWKKKDGTPIWVALTAHAIKDTTGQIVSFEGFINDITEKKHTEQALRESEGKHRRVLENVDEVIYQISYTDDTPLTERVDFVSKQSEQIIGYTPDEFLNDPTLWFKAVHPDDITSLREQTESIYKTQSSVTRLYRLRHKNTGEYHWMEDRVVPKYDPSGKLIGLFGVARDITNRKRAETALQESEQRYQTLAEISPVGIFRTDVTGATTYVNPKWCQISGLAANEALEDGWLRAVHPKDRESLKAGWQGSTQKLTASSAEYRFVRPDGSIAWVMGQAVPEKNAEGAIVGYVGTITDITERKNAEKGLRLFRTLIDHTNDAIEVIDPETGRILDMNERGCLDLGYSREEILSLNIFDIDPKVEKSLFTSAVEDLRNTGALLWEGIHQRKDGSTFPVEVNIKYIQFDRDYIVTVARDITDRKQAEETQLLQTTALESAANGVVITDITGKILWVNTGFTKISGYSLHEAIGQNPRMLKSGRQDDTFYKNLWETISTGNVWKGELTNKRKDGTLYDEEMTIAPVRDRNHKITHFVAIKQDISERKHLEKEKKRLEAQLQQAQKLESLGTLASGIAHDFNNILGIILGHSTLLTRFKEDPKMLSESIKSITKATERGASLVKQLLTFARKSEALFETVSINDMIREINKLLKETFPKTIVVSTSLQQDLPTIVADASQVHQVLLNLCVNARDAMPKGGTLSISTKTVEGEAVSLRFAKTTARQYVQIEVADTGLGMDEATRLRIFEPFFTTKGPGKGTGLGLAVVFGIVEHHSGFIDVRTAPGEGTSFTVYLPIPERALGELQITRKKGAEIRGGTETILLIEDEEMLRNLAKTILVSKGYTVLTADDGIQGVKMYQSHQKGIAVVVSDMGLPILNGKDVFKRIREINPGAKVIMASGFIEPEIKSEMFKAGMKHFIQKPYLYDEVLQKIREAIDTNG